MNNLVSTKLPAHLAHLAAKLPATSLAQGISVGGHPRISIKGSRFRLQSASGEEVVVPQTFLDVIILSQNPHGLSKIYYATKWDPSTPDGVAPDCFSDNGVSPSAQATKPQHVNCSMCPQNVWGSKISEVSGKQVKACQDVKKLAVLVAANVDGPAFELRVPGDSLKNLAAYAKSLDAHGIPYSAVITRLSFDTNVSHQRLTFQPAYNENGQMPYIDADQAEIVDSLLGTDEIAQCTGANDKPVDPAKFSLPAAGGVSTPGPSAQAPASTPPAAQAPGAQKRIRRTKVEMELVRSKEVEAPSEKPPLSPHPAKNNAAVIAPLVAPITNAALDETIRNLMNL